MIATNPMARMKQPKVVAQPVPVLSEDELRALIREAERDKSVIGKRDAAIVRMFVDTGARLTKIASLRVEDVDLDSAVVTFHTTKSSRRRSVPIASKTIVALDRWLAARSRTRFASSDAPWTGRLGRLKKAAIADVLARLARAAGIGDFHPHVLRHSWAHHARVAGIDDDALTRLAGWSPKSAAEMLARYGASRFEERAIDAGRRVGLGDRF